MYMHIRSFDRYDREARTLIHVLVYETRTIAFWGRIRLLEHDSLDRQCVTAMMEDESGRWRSEVPDP